jgi:endonuclease V-like protein UPF0215 family
MLEFWKSKWWTDIMIGVTGWENDWVDNLVSKEYKWDFTEISVKHISIKNNFGKYEYMSYILSSLVWGCYTADLDIICYPF